MKTVKQIADELGVDKQRVYRYIKANKIKESVTDTVNGLNRKYYDETVIRQIRAALLGIQDPAETESGNAEKPTADLTQSDSGVKAEGYAEAIRPETESDGADAIERNSTVRATVSNQDDAEPLFDDADMRSESEPYKTVSDESQAGPERDSRSDSRRSVDYDIPRNDINVVLVKALQEQLASKDRQIENLQKLLDQEQQLHMVAEQKLMMLEEKQNRKSGQEEENKETAQREESPSSDSSETGTSSQTDTGMHWGDSDPEPEEEPKKKWWQFWK